EAPYLFARRFSTLDHLTDGRVGWNIVTGYLDSAARAMGLREQIAHDERYDRADEFLDVVYQLWEGSWEDDAVLRDRAARVFAQ
ncbi:LLM class flavin-dependent oxidoreductase, partial [Stenotrophomonas maltophilia]